MPNLVLTSLGAVEAFFSHSNLHTANRQVDCYSCVRGLQLNKLPKQNKRIQTEGARGKRTVP